MPTDEPWPDLHDATLETLELRWASGELVLRIRTGDPSHPRREIVATSLSHLDCSRQMPWGPSQSINDARGPTPSGPDVSVLELEMQTGDVIRIEAGAFTLRAAPPHA